MIINLAHKLITKYENLSPRRKAQADMLGILFTCVICSGAIGLAAYFNLMFEFAMLMLAYGVFGMIRILYQSRVQYYEAQEKYNK